MSAYPGHSRSPMEGLLLSISWRVAAFQQTTNKFRTGSLSPLFYLFRGKYPWIEWQGQWLLELHSLNILRMSEQDDFSGTSLSLSQPAGSLIKSLSSLDGAYRCLHTQEFPHSSVVKESACNAGDLGLISGWNMKFFILFSPFPSLDTSFQIHDSKQSKHGLSTDYVMCLRLDILLFS